MTYSRTPDIYFKNQRFFESVGDHVPKIKEVDVDKFIHYSVLKIPTTLDGENIIEYPTHKNLIYWAREDFGLEKCIYDSGKKTAKFEKINEYPHQKEKLKELSFEYGSKICLSSFIASVGFSFGTTYEQINIPATLILGGSFFLLTYMITEDIQKFTKMPLIFNQEKQEILSDREAWKRYRNSPFGRKF